MGARKDGLVQGQSKAKGLDGLDNQDRVDGKSKEIEVVIGAFMGERKGSSII